ncbi:MAG: hypothetical protein HOP19_06515 [Acidobacteria bacterium]|nr:hypothetical protein [Acidobacteriota bacterium]
MAYGKYKDIQEVAKKYQIKLAVGAFVEPLPTVIEDHFRAELAYTLKSLDVRMSEAAISEFLIAPILREIWKQHREALLLWSHVSMKVGEEFDGYPDYLFTKLSPLGMVRDKPYLLVVEAKKDDFEGGWGQCLAAMIAAQTINENDQITLHGSVSNGDVWEFGKLQGHEFVRDQRSYTISALEELFAALNYVFTQATLLARQN